MGGGEQKSGFSKSNWITIALIVLLVILALVLVWILKDPRGFDRFKRKKKAAPPLKPTSMYQQLHDSNYQPGLELVDDRLRVVAKLSWQESVLSSLKL